MNSSATMKKKDELNQSANQNIFEDFFSKYSNDINKEKEVAINSTQLD